jgi:hypothetical protein
MMRKYVVTLEDTLKGWQEDEDELERKYGAEPLDCGNCEIVQASISTGVKTASRLVDGVLDKIKTEIEEQVLESLSDGGDDWFAAEKVNECLEIIDKYKADKEGD